MNIWITGASKGIGRAIAEELLREGHTVAVSARSKELLDTIAKGGSENIFRYPLDVNSLHAVDSTVKTIQKDLGSVDVLINCAGTTTFKTLLDTSIEEFDDIIDINLKGTFYCVKSVLPEMLARKKGWIFNIISVTVDKVFTKSGAYAASKAGVLAFTKVLRDEVRSEGIKVTAVVPGATLTDMWPEKVREQYGNRMIKPEDVAKVIAMVLKIPENVMFEDFTIRPILGDL